MSMRKTGLFAPGFKRERPRPMRNFAQVTAMGVGIGRKKIIINKML